MVGIKVSRMSPNLCTVCETFFSRVYGKKQRLFPATVLFADLRGYTSMSEDTSSEDVVDMLDSFYDECADAIWERDGVVNKFMGDAVLAIFNFPYTRDDHAEQATLAAQDRDGHSDRGWRAAAPRSASASASASIPDRPRSARLARPARNSPSPARW